MSVNNQTAHQIDAFKRTDDVKLASDDNIDFSNMMLSPNVLKGLLNAGFVKPSPIQLKAIPVGRCGLDLIVQAKSGTGKTCVFTVIALETVNTEINAVQILVLAPTREIVVQIADVVKSVGSAMPKLKCCTFIGGISIEMDKINSRQCHIAVGTPGRTKQLIKDKLLDLNAVRLFVLDEADKLLEESFQKDINWIYHHVPATKQMVALSATYPEELAQFLTRYMQSPTFVRLNADNPTLLGIKQFYRKTTFHPLPSKCFENKIPHIVDILSNLPFRQCLIFSNNKMQAENLRNKLDVCGWPATCICGDMEQNQRLTVMTKMKQFQCRVLVSTDLTARGIDIFNINVVINLDVPKDLETYLHRMGRAGRFGSHGISITLAAEGKEETLLETIKNTGNLPIKKTPEQISSDLWNLNTSEELEPYINDCDEERASPDVSNIEQNGNQKLLFESDTAISAGHIEVWKHKENIRKEKLGQRFRLESKSDTFSQDTIDVTSTVDLSLVLQQLINDVKCPNQDKTSTFSEDEKDLLDFLKKVEDDSECNVCSDVHDNKLNAGKYEPALKQLPNNVQVVNGFLHKLNETFFHNLKKDLTPVLDLDRDEELKNTLENWMAYLKLADNAEYDDETQNFPVKNLSTLNVTPTCIEKSKKQKQKKAKKQVATNTQSTLDNQRAKETPLSHTTQQFHTEAGNESYDNFETSCNYNQPNAVYNYPVTNQYNYENFNEWYRSIRTTKYLVWYQEYTKYMLNSTR